MEALRSIVGTARRRPAKLAYFVVSLGVSFGFIAAVVTLAHASWFRLPTGVADQAYVTALRETGGGLQSMSIRDFDEIVARVPEISWLYTNPAYGRTLEPDGSAGSPGPLQPHLVSPGFFEQLGVRPAFGALAVTEGAPGAVISHEVWSGAYGRQDVVGEFLTMADDTSIPIIGVAPPGFESPLQLPADAWVMNLPLQLSVPPWIGDVNTEGRRRIARMSPDITVFGVIAEGRDVDAEFAAASARLAEHRFDSKMVLVELESDPSAQGDAATNRMMYAFGISDSDRVALGPGLETSPEKRRDVVQKTLWLACVVAMLLLMAFVSVVEFLLAEHVSREDEQHVRIAVGAAPLDLFGRALSENLLLALVMGVLGWLAAGYVLDVLLRVEPFSSYFGEVSAASSTVGLGIAAFLLVLAFVVCLGYVSWFISRSSAALARSSQWLRWTTRQFLLLVCVASFMVVLSLAGRYLVDAGLSLGLPNPDVTSVELRSPGEMALGIEDRGQLSAAIGEIEAVPGVHAVASAMLEPLGPKEYLHQLGRKVTGFPEVESAPFFENSVTSSFFRTLGVELLAGRIFEDDNYLEIVLSRSAAEALGGSDVVVGAPLRVLARGDEGLEKTVVGVVGDVPYGDYTEAIPRMIYGPRIGFAYPHRWLIDADPGLDLAAALAQLPRYADWEVEIGDTPAQRFRKQFLAKRSVEVVLAVAAGFALVLALSGVGNSLARNVAETRSRIGIRFALGATPGELAFAQSATSLRELVVAAAVVGGAGMAAKLWLPAFAEALELWWLLPAFASLAVVCALLIRFLLGQLARNHSISALVDGSVADARQGGA